MKKQSRLNREIRLEHNRELLNRMKADETLQSHDSSASWYPPRPVIEKSRDEVKRLYGSGAKVLESKTVHEKLSRHATDESGAIILNVNRTDKDDEHELPEAPQKGA